ncbi:hypothetical protein LLR47_30455 [Bacillus cereus]|uniref:hypothetical protein n=1 Tax=Bacillus cereus TaxID=1396 RepID=UPI001D1499A9|nr:hypothetical protein [Bacillus cereus]MCC3689446.1 hypothetical protein [Bacillus cereus]
MIELKFRFFDLLCLVQKIYFIIKIAFKILIYQENTSKYLISLGFLNKSYMTYIEAKRFYRENEELVSVEFDNFFDMYDKLENELKQVISTEDKNPSLLHSRLDQFQQKVENINDLIKVLQNAR